MPQDDDSGRVHDDGTVDVARLRARDSAEWARVVPLAAPSIRAAIRRFATDDSDVDDLLQECWIRVLNQIDKFSGYNPDGSASLSSLKAWAVVVSLNHCRDLYRVKMRTPESGAESTEDLDDILDGGPNPEELFRQRHLQQAVWKALGTLPEREREAIVLKHGEGRSTAEIAVALNVSPASVRRLIHRATYKLRKVDELRE